MNIFSLDCAGKSAGVAICCDGKLVYESYKHTQQTHSETLLQMCDSAFKSAEITPSDVDLFAVTSGPGSYTGLRIGVSLIKGLALAQNTPCAGVSTLETLAEAYMSDALIATVLDARRDNVFCAAFEKNDDILTRILQDELINKDVFYDTIAKICIAKGYKHIVFMGDGSHLFSGRDLVKSCPAGYNNGRAHAICNIAQKMYSLNLHTTASQLLPNYLRPSQAERQFNKPK